jgi:nucleotide-binding universal stress UspA family protein
MHMLTSSTWHTDWQALSRHGLRRDRIFQSILFPVDFSDACNSTARYVRDLAEVTGGSVTLLHVVPWRPAWYGAPMSIPGLTTMKRCADSKKSRYQLWRDFGTNTSMAFNARSG